MISGRQVRRRYLILHALRWLPTGLAIPVFVLLMLDRGLNLGQIGAVAAIQGLVVLFLELPTGGLADALGRRPVLLVSSAVGIASIALFVVAQSIAVFAAALVLQGVYRALDSGPLESWYVDATLADDPEADIGRGLSAGGVVIGVAISTGALLSGVLVALDPLPNVDALTTPVVVGLSIQVIALVAIAVLLVEVRPARGAGALRASVRQVPTVIRESLRLVRRSRVLLALVSVELFWGFGMVTFETLLPVRLSEVVGDPDRAASLLGPAGSVAWLGSSLGAALVPLAVRRIGAEWTGAVLRIAQGTTVVGMALFAGPVGVLIAYLCCYVVHGASNPVHTGLLHRQVESGHRTTVLSVNSMVGQPSGAIGLVVLTTLADATSVTTAMLTGAVMLAMAAPLYLVGRRGHPEPLAEPAG